MRKSQLTSVIVITTLLASIFCVYSIDNTVRALTNPSVDTTTDSHKLEYVLSAGSASLTVTTSTAQEIIYATFYSQTSGYGLSISSTPVLTWHYRGGGNTSSSNGEIAAWWAVSTIAQSVQITFTSSHTNTNEDYVISAFCVMNADTVSPFDPNLSSATFNNANSASASASITTTNPNDLVIGALGFINIKTITTGNGYTILDSVINAGSSGANEYLALSTTGTYAPTFTLGSGVAWVVIADAFVGYTTLTVLPEYGFGGLTAFVVSLGAMLVFFKGKKAVQKLKIQSLQP